MIEMHTCPSCRTETPADSSFCRGCGAPIASASAEKPGIHWRWVLYGIAIMYGANIVAGIGLGLFLIGSGASAENLEENLSPLLIGIVALVSFGVGGFIVGWRSPGRTILEAGIAAFAAATFSAVGQGTFEPVALLFGGGFPFLAALGGGYLGEKVQGNA